LYQIHSFANPELSTAVRKGNETESFCAVRIKGSVPSLGEL